MFKRGKLLFKISYQIAPQFLKLKMSFKISQKLPILVKAITPTHR